MSKCMWQSCGSCVLVWFISSLQMSTTSHWNHLSTLLSIWRTSSTAHAPSLPAILRFFLFWLQKFYQSITSWCKVIPCRYLITSLRWRSSQASMTSLLHRTYILQWCDSWEFQFKLIASERTRFSSLRKTFKRWSWQKKSPPPPPSLKNLSRINKLEIWLTRLNC